MRFPLVNIESRDGTSTGIKITDADTGSVIPGVTEADIFVRPDDVTKVNLTIMLAKVRLQAAAIFFVFDPRSGARKRVAKIVYHDGQVFEPGAE